MKKRLAILGGIILLLLAIPQPEKWGDSDQEFDARCAIAVHLRSDPPGLFRC